MRRLALLILVLVLSLAGVGIAPQHAKAEPLPADYSGFAAGGALSGEFALLITPG